MPNAKDSPSVGTTAISSPARALPAGRPITAAQLMHLQAAAGNRVVQRLVARGTQAPVQRQMVSEEDAEEALGRQAVEREQELHAVRQMGRAGGTGATFRMPPLPADAGAGGIDRNGLGGLPGSSSSFVRPMGSDGRAAGVGAGPHPAPLKLPEKYASEQTTVGSWRGMLLTGDLPAGERQRREAFNASDRIVTRYNTPEDQRRNALTPQDGQLRTASGALGQTVHPQYQGDERATIYAMGTDGQIVGNLDNTPQMSNVLLPDGRPQQQRQHHSSMLAGADVAHAGHLGVTEGQVSYLDDDSGHYMPSGAHTFDAFNRLADQGVLDPTSTAGRVNLVDKSVAKGGQRGASADLSFAAYSQTGGNEAAIRAKEEALRRIAPSHGVAREEQQARAKEQHGHEIAQAQQVAREQAAREQAAREQAAREQAARAAAEAAARAEQERLAAAGAAPELERFGSFAPMEDAAGAGAAPLLDRMGSEALFLDSGAEDQAPEAAGAGLAASPALPGPAEEAPELERFGSFAPVEDAAGAGGPPLLDRMGSEALFLDSGEAGAGASSASSSTFGAAEEAAAPLAVGTQRKIYDVPKEQLL